MVIVVVVMVVVVVSRRVVRRVFDSLVVHISVSELVSSRPGFSGRELNQRSNYYNILFGKFSERIDKKKSNGKNIRLEGTQEASSVHSI